MQTWNDILSYIKLELGATVNLLELSDDDIINYIKQHILPYFSQYVPCKKYVLITTNDLQNPSTGQPRYVYKLPIPQDEYIIDVVEVYFPADIDNLSIPVYGYFDAINTVISNSYTTALRSLSVRNTWEFVPPNIIIFDLLVSQAVVVYNVPHTNPKTIPPDLYHTLFKPLCTAYVKIWIASLRSKFTTLSTSFGNIELNWQELKQEGLQQKTMIEEKLAILPPDKLVEISL